MINLQGRSAVVNVSNPQGSLTPPVTGVLNFTPFVESGGPNSYAASTTPAAWQITAGWNEVESWWNVTLIALLEGEATINYSGILTDEQWGTEYEQEYVDIAQSCSIDGESSLAPIPIPNLEGYGLGFDMTSVDSEDPEILPARRVVLNALSEVTEGIFRADRIRREVLWVDLIWDSEEGMFSMAASFEGGVWNSVQEFTKEELEESQEVTFQLDEEGEEEMFFTADVSLFTEEIDRFSGKPLQVEFANNPIPSSWPIELDGLFPANDMVKDWPTYRYENNEAQHFIYQVDISSYVIYSEPIFKDEVWRFSDADEVIGFISFEPPGISVIMENFMTEDAAEVLYTQPEAPQPVARVEVPYVLRKSAMPRDRVGLLNYARSLITQGAEIETATNAFAAALTAANTPSTRSPVTVQAAATAEQQLRLAVSRAVLSVPRSEYERKSVESVFNFPAPSIRGFYQRAGQLEFVFKGRPKGKNVRMFSVEVEAAEKDPENPLPRVAVGLTKSPARLQMPQELGGRKIRVRGKWMVKTSDRWVSGPWTAWQEFALVAWQPFE